MQAIFKFIKFLIFIAIVAILVLVIFRNQIVKTGLEKGGEFVGVPTMVNSVSISIDKPVFEMEGLYVSNPTGKNFSDETLLDLNRFMVHYDVMGLFKNTVHVSDMAVDVNALNVELNSDGKLNLTSIAPAGEKKEKAETEEQEGKEGKEPPMLKIDRLMVRVGNVKFTSANAMIPSFNLPMNYSNVFENVEGQGSEVAIKVLTQVANGTPLEPILKMGDIDFNKSLDQLKGQLNDAAGQAKEALSGASDNAQKAISGASDSAKEALSGATDSVKGAADEAAKKLKGLFK